MNPQVDPDRICVGCMEELPEPLSVCPFCQTDNAAEQNASSQLSVRTILYGKYLIGRTLGAGGFGITYIGMDMNLKVKVAIKEYMPLHCACRWDRQGSEVCPVDEAHRAAYEAGKEQFLEEARTLARFAAVHRHSGGIVAVRDFFTGNGTAYLVMDYISGGTLKQYVARRGGKLPVQEALALLEPVIRSLEQLHGDKLLHLDISPDNIMIDTKGFAILIDFGASKKINGDSKGRPLNVKKGYAPPEQYDECGKRGPWTDVYALCATLYKVITGVTPPQSLSRMMDSSHLKKPSELGIEMPRQQETALMRGMALEIPRRIGDMQTLWRELYTTSWRPITQEVTRQEIAQARRKLLKRRFGPLLVGAAVLAGGIAIALWQPFGEKSLQVSTVPSPTPAAAQTSSPAPTAVVLPSPSSSPTSAPTSAPPPSPSPSSAKVTPAVSPKPTPTPSPTQTVIPATPAETPTPTLSVNNRQQQFTQEDVRYQLDHLQTAQAIAYTASGGTCAFSQFVGGSRNFPLKSIASTFSQASDAPKKVARLVFPDQWAIKIEDGAFSSFSSLTVIEGGSGVEDVSKHAFAGTKWIADQRQTPPNDGFLTLFNGVLLEYTGKEQQLLLPTSIRVVAQDAFEGKETTQALSFAGSVLLQAGAFNGLNLASLSFAATPSLRGNPFAAEQSPVSVAFDSGAKVPFALIAWLPKGSQVTCDAADVDGELLTQDGVQWILRD